MSFAPSCPVHSQNHPEVIGIDLGTTFIKAAYWDEAKKESVVVQVSNESAWPSVVAYPYSYFTNNSSGAGSSSLHGVKTGKTAQNVLIGKGGTPDNHFVFWDAKRFIGLKMFESQVTAVQSYKDSLPFAIVANESRLAMMRGIYQDGPLAEQGKFVDVLPKDISKHLLMALIQKLKSKSTMKDVNKFSAIITIPANFKVAQREATLQAAEEAGMEVLQTLPEPTAAFLGYHTELKGKTESGTYCVFDFGGGTLDVSVLEVNSQKNSVEVLGIGGNTFLGRRDIDELLFDHIAQEIEEKHQLSVYPHNPAKRKEVESYANKLRAECPQLKQTANDEEEASITLEQIGFKDLNNVFNEGTITITAKDLEDLIKKPNYRARGMNMQEKKQDYSAKSLADEMVQTVRLALDQAKITNPQTQLKGMLLAGGSARLKVVHKVLAAAFEGVKLLQTEQEDKLVVKGAARQAYNLAVVGKAAVTTTNSVADNQPSSGAAITLKEVTPASLGTGVIGKKNRPDLLFSVVLPCNTRYPASNTKHYQTSSDNQTQVSVEIYEGEKKLVKNNQLLDEFTITGFPPKPEGEVKVDITFNLNHNGILVVTAKALGYDNAQGTKEVQVKSLMQEKNQTRPTQMNEDIKIHTEINKLALQIYSAQYLLKSLPFAQTTQFKRELNHLESFAHGFGTWDYSMEDIVQRSQQIAALKESILKQKNDNQGNIHNNMQNNNGPNNRVAMPGMTQQPKKSL